MTDDRLKAVRDELGSGEISPQSLVLLFNVASEAEHAGDLETLEEALTLAREIARTGPEGLRDEAERLSEICEQTLTRVRRREEAAVSTSSTAMTCPDCGNEVPANALRCRRCGHRFLD